MVLTAGRSADRSTVSMTLVSHMEIVSNILYSGMSEKFPKLKAISVDSDVGCLPYLLEELHGGRPN